MINPQSILDIPMRENDAGAATIRDYLIKLLTVLWEEDEGFSGKRPFGNSGWSWDLLQPLVTAGVLNGTLDEDGIGQLDHDEEDRGHRLIAAAIISLGWVQSPEPAAFA